MYNNANAEQLMEKWSPVLDHGEAIADPHKRAVTAQLLENQAVALAEEKAFLSETPTVNTLSNTVPGAGQYTAGFSADATDAGPVAGFDPVLVSLIRRSMPNPNGIRHLWRSAYERSYRTNLRNALPLQ